MVDIDNKTQSKSHAIRDAYKSNRDDTYRDVKKDYKDVKGMSYSQKVNARPDTYNADNYILTFLQKFPTDEAKAIAVNRLHNSIDKIAKMRETQLTLSDYDPYVLNISEEKERIKQKRNKSSISKFSRNSNNKKTEEKKKENSISKFSRNSNKTA